MCLAKPLLERAFAAAAAANAPPTPADDLFLHAVVTVSNLAEALNLEFDAVEAIRRGDVTPDAAPELMRRIQHVKGLFCRGIPVSAWVPDTEAEVCMACQRTRFSQLRRRHHCRNCGHLICSSCCKTGQLSEEVQMDKLCRTCHAFCVRRTPLKLSTARKFMHYVGGSLRRLSGTGAAGGGDSDDCTVSPPQKRRGSGRQHRSTATSG